MPRGVPKLGRKLTKDFLAKNPEYAHLKNPDGTLIHHIRNTPEAGAAPILNLPTMAPVVVESDEEIDAKLVDRFEVIENLVKSAIDGSSNAVILSGAAGLGKSHTVMRALEAWDPAGESYTVVKGYSTAVGLMTMLYRHREEGELIVFDDCDSIFSDEKALNILKAACDTNKKRTVSYMAKTQMFDEDTGDNIPSVFDFQGTIIFITNYDFDWIVERDNKITPHVKALMSRAQYVCIPQSKRYSVIRIKQVLKEGLLRNKGMTKTQEDELMGFISTNINKIREVSLRMVLKLAAIRKHSPKWERDATITLCKGE